MEKHKLVYELLLVGDSGNIKRNHPDELLELIKFHLPDSTNSAVIFLGDNIYPKGFPDIDDPLRKDAEKALINHQKILNDFKGRVIFISGNHDWNKGKLDGLAYFLRQQDFLQKIFNQDDILLPKNGCPGPTEINVSDHLVIVAINSQWWIQKGERPIGKEYGCDIENEEDFFVQLTAILDKNEGKRILVIGHYPIYSYSLHGGRYQLKHHLFPFTLYKKNVYFPLPLVGSLLPLYRKYFGAKEDLSHPRFRILRKRLKTIFKNYPKLIYAAGHEHNLQWIEKNNNSFIVSGSASKATYVLSSKYSRFGISAKGFFKLKFYDDKRVEVEVIIVDENNKAGELIYNGWMM